LKPHPARLGWKHWSLALFLLLLFFAQGAAAIPRLSLTADEPAFVGPGLAYLQTGDLRLETAAAHPPLLFVLTAAPLLLQPLPDVTTLPGWAEADLSIFSRAFVTSLGAGLESATFAARLPILLLALVGAALVFRWAADGFGPWAGLAALALFTCDPNVLAHATLATTDLGLAVFGFASAYLLLRALRRGSRGLLLAAGLALGLTLGAKSSGVFTLCVLVPLFLIARLVGLAPGAPRRASLSRVVGEVAVLVGLAGLVLWGLYRFELRPLENGTWPLPFATQWETWLGTQAHARGGHTAFLMGEIRDTGWWYYYPVAFLLKTPLPTLILLVVAGVSFLRQGWRRWRTEALLWVYPAAYALVTLGSTIAIGYRFLLVVLPFLYVFIARLIAPRAMHHVLRLTFCALLLWYVIGAALIHPHYLAYFNELAGGPEGGYRYLVDSNLDWGQSFKALQEYLKDERVEDEVWLSYYTYADPALYGIRYQPIAPSPGAPPTLPSRFDPPPGVYVVSATTLQGVMVADPDAYAWFRHREPIARPGFALFVYRVPPSDADPTWLAQCTLPVAPLSAEVAREGLGRSDLRVATFDCAHSWLLPTGGQSPGWYALFRDTALGGDAFIQAHLAQAQMSYEQRQPRALPPFALYQQAAGQFSPHTTPESTVRVGHLTFLGYTSDGFSSMQSGQTIGVETWWRVDSLPERPLSIMMHVTRPDGTPIAVGDGLGVPIENWQAGDIVIQRHLLTLPVDTPEGEYSLATGAYWLDTLERWPVRLDNGASDRLFLDKIAVMD
jgi:4-amino-4-deoxy-L-arabinose transferase-like glycosyltransferase